MEWLHVDIDTLQVAYSNGDTTPSQVLRLWMAKARNPDYQAIWICQFEHSLLLGRAAALELHASLHGIGKLPLYGVLVAVKDNIDVKGLATTAACPAFSYLPEQSALCVDLLEQAGAIIVGKTNLDQFATGLVGIRTPYGEVANAFDPRYLSGGSSSGSAVAVALGEVHLALATDTAGSGRVPAALNNLVGLKPSVGLISTSGVVPACRTLDCVSIMARTVSDAASALSVLTSSNTDILGRKPEWARRSSAAPLRIAIPLESQLNFFDDMLMQDAYFDALTVLKSMDVEIEEVDFSPFLKAAALLYEGPFVAERLEAPGDLLRDQPESLDPVVAKVIARGKQYTALDVFHAQRTIQILRKQVGELFTRIDALVVPSIPALYTREATRANPLELNSRLGTYTNGVNLLDLCALTLPSGFRADGMPASITLIAPALHDMQLAQFGQRIQKILKLPLGATEQAFPEYALPVIVPADTIKVAVVGAHLSGMPLNKQLTERDAKLVTSTRTASEYRLYHLKDFVPPRPGLMRTPANGAAIAVEIWEMPLKNFGSFVALIPAPLGIGSVILEDGSSVRSFICEAYALDGATDITSFGSWKNYINSLI